MSASTPPPELSGIVFDTAAVLSWCARHPYPQGIYWSYVTMGGTVVIPAAVLGALLAEATTVVPILDPPAAAALGALLAEREHQGDADALISAGHAAAEARRRGWYVLTDRAELLAGLDPELLLNTLP